MSSLSIIPACANLLKATTAITSLLPDGANGIVPAFSLIGDTFPTTLHLPTIVLKDSGTFGLAREIPFLQTTLMVMVYDTGGSPNSLSYARIDQLIFECITALDRATLTMESSYYNLFEIQFDNYISGDMFDIQFRLPYKTARFRAHLATHLRT